MITSKRALGTVIDLNEELEKRRSGIRDTVPEFHVGGGLRATLEDLRDRYVLIVSMRENDPSRLTDSGLAVFNAHQQVVEEFGFDDPEDIYGDSAAAPLMRARLQELEPSWFLD